MIFFATFNVKSKARLGNGKQKTQRLENFLKTFDNLLLDDKQLISSFYSIRDGVAEIDNMFCFLKTEIAVKYDASTDVHKLKFTWSAFNSELTFKRID